jgi:hypothetical protein
MYCDDKPNTLEKRNLNNRYYYVVRFNINFDSNIGMWKYDEVKLPYGKPNYEVIVNELVTFKYPVDKMQAVINNYLLDGDDPSIKDEFKQMQDWRKFSKEYAKEIIKNF